MTQPWTDQGEQMHSKEPWSSDGYSIESEDGLEILGRMDVNTNPRAAEDLARVVACVNFCRGLDTKELETKMSAGIVAMVRNAILEAEEKVNREEE